MTNIYLYRGLARAAAYRGIVRYRLSRESTGDESAAWLQSARAAFRCARILCGDHVQPRITR